MLSVSVVLYVSKLKVSLVSVIFVAAFTRNVANDVRANCFAPSYNFLIYFGFHLIIDDF